MTSLEARLVSNAYLAEVFADAIKVPLDDWYGKCHEISLAIVRTGMLKGPEGARVRVARGWHPHVPLRQHSWIALGDPYDPSTRYVDPTLWCYTGDEPRIFSALAGDTDHTPHGDGDIWDWGRPEHQGGPTIELQPAQPLSEDARLILEMIGPLDYRGWMTLSSAPVGGWPAGEIFAAMHHTEDLRGLVPIDKLGMTTDLNPSSLYW